MCLIIDKPKGILFPEEDLLSAIHTNDEGFGWMWADKETKTVKFGKGVDYTPESIVDFCATLKDTHALLHLRFNTAGLSDQANCHPFKVLDKRVHGHDLFLMHNGTINKCKPGFNEPKKRTDLSDTRIFAEEVLRPLLEKYGPDALNNLVIKELLEDYIGYGSKLALLSGDGTVYKLNEDKGEEKHGCWVSNTYSFNRTHRDPSVNTYGYNGNQGVRTLVPGTKNVWEWPAQKTAREKREKEAASLAPNLGAKEAGGGDAVVPFAPNPTGGDTAIPTSATALGVKEQDEILVPPVEVEETVGYSEIDWLIENYKWAALEDVELFVFDNPEEASELIYTLLERL